VVAVTCRRHGLQTCPDTKKYCVRSCAVLACVQAGYQVPVVLVGLGLAFAEVAVRDVGKMAGARELAAGRKVAVDATHSCSPASGSWSGWKWGG